MEFGIKFTRRKITSWFRRFPLFEYFTQKKSDKGDDSTRTGYRFILLQTTGIANEIFDKECGKVFSEFSFLSPLWSVPESVILDH
jgi:hypothetical protein